MGDHGVYCAHKKLFDTTVRVPLRVKFPKGRFAGQNVGALVQHVDIAPTVAALAGFSEPLYMGHDLAPVAAGEAPGHEVAFAEHVDNFMRSVRDAAVRLRGTGARLGEQMGPRHGGGEPVHPRLRPGPR